MYCHSTEIRYEKAKTIFTKQNDNVTYNESNMDEEGKSEDDQEGIHNDENGRDDDEDDDGNHGNYNNDYNTPRLQQVQQQCNNITNRV